MNLADWNQYLTPVGVTGWLVFFVVLVVRERSAILGFVGLVSMIAISDLFAMQQGSKKDSASPSHEASRPWLIALALWCVIVWWLARLVFAKRRATPSP